MKKKKNKKKLTFTSGVSHPFPSVEMSLGFQQKLTKILYVFSLQRLQCYRTKIRFASV